MALICQPPKIAPATPSRQRLATPERQLVEHRRHQPVPDVEDRRSPLAFEAVAVLREQRVAVEHADAAAVVLGLRQRVADQHRESAIEPPGEFRGQRVVLGLGDVADLLDLGELRIRPPALHAAGPRRHLVGVVHPLEPFAAGPEIADLQCRRRPELALDVEDVLNHVRRLAVELVAQDVVIRHADQRRLHAAGVGARSGERRVPVEIQQHRIGDVLTTAGRVARHVEPRVAGVLHVEDAGAGADRPARARRPRPPHTRSEVQLVVIDQATAQPAVARDLDVRREPDR